MSSPRSPRELSGAVESRKEPPGAAGSRQEPPGRLGSCQEVTKKPPGAVGSRQEPPGAVGSRQEPARRAARSRREPSGAARETWELTELTQKPPGAVASRQEPGSRSELSGAHPYRRLGSIENRALRGASMIRIPTAGPLWGLEIQPELRSWRETSGEH